jgi:hypothetical protein
MGEGASTLSLYASNSLQQQIEAISKVIKDLSGQPLCME